MPSYTFDKPLDIIDAIFEDNLFVCSSPLIKFERVPITPASVAYKVRSTARGFFTRDVTLDDENARQILPWDGDLGEIKLIKLGSETTKLTVYLTPLTGRNDYGLSLCFHDGMTCEALANEQTQAVDNLILVARRTLERITGNRQGKPAELQLWERIPDHAWDRVAVKLLYDGLSNSEIAQKLSASTKTVANRLSCLRKQYPDIVLTREEMQRRPVERFENLG